MSAKPRCRRWNSSVLSALFATSVASAAPTSLADLLRSLSASGLDILYSSDLVSPDLTVPETPRDADPLSRVREALAVYQLELRSDGPNRYIVARSAVPHAAKTTAAQTPGEGLSEVTVFASRYVLEDAPGTGQAYFGHDDLERVPGAQGDALRAIRTVPGLANNLSSRPYVRGAFLEDVLVRFDGIAMVDPFHFKNFQNLVSAFDPATVQRIDVYTGGFPVKYGGRSAAVFDVTPRTVESGYEHRVGANLLSYDLSTVGRFDSWPIEWLATARHSTQNIVLQPSGTEIGEPSYADTLGRLRWQLNPSTAVTAGWMLLDDQVASSTDPNTQRAVAHDRDLYSWAAAEWAPNGAVRSRSSLAMTSIERTLVGDLSLPGVASGHVDESRDTTTVDLNSDWTFLQTDSLLWELGAETTFERANLNFARQERFAAILAASMNRMADVSLANTESPRSTTVGLYASARRRWRNFEAEVGVRADHQDYRGFGSHSQLSPRIHLRFDPAPAWHVYGSWGHFREAQRVDEWRLEQDQTKPDSATHIVDLIAGVTQDVSPATHWRIEAYDNHWLTAHPYFDNSLNRLSALPELGIDRVLIAPHGGDSAGVESSVRHAISDNWLVSASYALSRTTDDLPKGDVLRSWDQTHALNAEVTWQHALSSASLVVGWHSGWPKTPVSFVPATATVPAYLQIGARNSARWASYFSADLRLAHTVPLRLGDLLLWADATNVTNRPNQCCTSYGQVDPLGNLRIPSTTSWFPRVLNVGFEWRLRPNR